MITHNWCVLLETPLLPLAMSLDLSTAASTIVFYPVSSGSSNFSCRFSVAAKLIGEFASLEEPIDDADAVIVVGMTNGVCHGPSYLTAGVPGVSTA
jgi:hypothetical protein